jgi:hypothetical protein
MRIEANIAGWQSLPSDDGLKVYIGNGKSTLSEAISTRACSDQAGRDPYDPL